MKIKSNETKSQPPVLTLAQAFESIKAVGRGQAPLPDWAGKKVYIGEDAKSDWETVETKTESLDSFSKLLTENKELIAAIAHDMPESVAALARIVHRDESNVSRTLGKLARFGIVNMVSSEKGRTKRPMLAMERIRFDLDLLTGRMFLTGMRHPANAE